MKPVETLTEKQYADLRNLSQVMFTNTFEQVAPILKEVRDRLIAERKDLVPLLGNLSDKDIVGMLFISAGASLMMQDGLSMDDIIDRINGMLGTMQLEQRLKATMKPQ